MRVLMDIDSLHIVMKTIITKHLPQTDDTKLWHLMPLSESTT